MNPTFEYEQAIWQQGYRAIIGVDEVGRGCWAGPVVAGAAVLDPSFPESLAQNKTILIRDSKQLTPAQRQQAADFLVSSPLCAQACGVASVAEINQLGIAPATFLAMSRAIDQLQGDFVLLDAFTHPSVALPQQAIVKGDALSLSIAAASIVAKVFRDNLMSRLHQEYPQYALDKHKGYGTKIHQQAIEQYGLTDMHRTNFKLKFLAE